MPKDTDTGGGLRGLATTTLLTTTSASFLTPFISSAVNVALPAIGSEFKLGTVELGWIQATFLLTVAIFLVPFGKVADIVGRKRVFTWGLVVYTLASLVGYYSPNAVILIASRILQGVGGAMLSATAVALVTSVFPPSVWGRVLGINVATVYAAIAMGPFLGGLLTGYYGWRSIFLVNAAAGLVSLALALQVRGEWRGRSSSRYDVLGSLLYGASLTAIMWGLLSASSSSLEARRLAGYSLAGGLLVLVAFAVWELRVGDPVIDLRLFTRSPSFLFSNISALINYSATYALSYLLSLYLQLVKGYSPQEAGSILLVQPLVQSILSPLGGALSDKLSPWKVASIGIGLNALGLLMLSTLTPETSVQAVMGMLVVMGVGFALFSAPNTNAIMSSVPREYHGTASAVVSTMRTVGQTMSIAIATIILTVYAGHDVLHPSSTAGLIKGTQASFLVLASLCAVGVFTSLARSKNNG